MKKFALALGLLALVACARPVAPEGGPKDTTPPKLVSEKSTPNLSTRFSARSFQLTFDEWVSLKDVGAQVLVSPPLAKRPEVTLKGRTVTFKLDKDEVLRPNTTYTVNFGTAVKDLHEDNPAKDLRFVFSTGDAIDSLTLSGVVIDAFTGEPLENISVLLYDSFADSTVLKDRPYYVARSDKSGQFSIPNVRAGTFRCIAIDDATPNLRWDDTERIGFPDSLVQISDSLSSLPAIRLFSPTPALRLRTRQVNYYGRIALGFSARPDTVAVRAEGPAGLRWLREQEQDSLLVWYDLADSTGWTLLAGADTVAVRPLPRLAFLETARLRFADETTAAPGASGRRGRSQPDQAPPTAALPPPRTVTVAPFQPVALDFNHPVVRVDTALCRLTVDSAAFHAFDFRLDNARPRSLELLLDWQFGKKYRLQFLPGALTDFFGITNTDTLQRNFQVPEEKQLGDLKLSLEGLEPGAAYLLQLISNNKLETERFFTADSSAAVQFVFQKLQPLPYTVQLIADRNENQRWDPGDFFTRMQPEAVFIKKLDPLRANWEVEASLKAQTDSGRRE